MAKTALTPDQEKFVEFLSTKNVKLACPCCGNRNEFIATGPHVLLEQGEVGLRHFGGSTVPIMLLTCRNCAYTRSFAWALIRGAAK